MRRYALAVSILGSALLLSSSDRPFSVQEKAHFTDPAVVNFVRPGLVVKVLSAQIGSDGTITVRFTLADPQGLLLDRTGVNTPGAVATTFIAAWLPNNQSQYVSYIVNNEIDPASGRTTVEAAADSGGTYTANADGSYTYVFKNKATGVDATATQSIGVYASRPLTDFDLGTYYSNDVYSWVPNGAQVTHVRDVVRTATCNKCHDPLSAHGGARQDVRLCVLCHTPQTTDAETNNTVDFKVMIHKIHMGSQLPSVQAGTPYVIIGYHGSVNDFSKVVFPAESPANCQFCHDPNSGATQANAWMSNPGSQACGSCHDNVNFATGQNHVNLPVTDDNLCKNCHIPQGESEFDASITGAHTLPRFSTQLPGTTFTLVRVDNGTAGKNPVVTFTVKDKAGNPIDVSTMNSLSLVMAGPTTDYSTYVSEDARKAQNSGGGTFVWTMTHAVPADAHGTWSIGIEGYRNITLNPGTVIQATQRDAGANQVINFSVDGTAVQARRTVVVQAQCDQCHYSVFAHGGIRNRVIYCPLCHNPNQTDAPVRPAAQNPPQGIDFSMLIHRVHTGADQESDYSVYTFNGTPDNFTEVLFPGDRRDCAKCHVSGSQELPLQTGLLPVQNPRGFINPQGPVTTACLGCHTAQDAAAHASLNASATLGEACAVCHGPDADFSVDRVHAR